jgi:hypothetical protein
LARLATSPSAVLQEGTDFVAAVRTYLESAA